MKSHQFSQTQYSNYSVENMNMNRYGAQNSPKMARVAGNGRITSKINACMPRIVEQPQPSYTQSNLYVLHEQDSSRRRQLRYGNVTNNIKILQPPITQYRDGVVRKEETSPCEINTVQMDVDLKSLKQSTIYRQKPSSEPYTPEEMYFGLFSLKNKIEQLRASSNNYTSNYSSNSNTKRSNNMNFNMNTVSLEQNTQKTKDRNSQLQEMKKQYNRLRRYLQQLEQQNNKLRHSNTELIKNTNSIKQQKQVLSRNVNINSQYNHSTRTNRNKMGANQKKRERNFSLTSRTNYNQQKTYEVLFIQAKQEITKRDKIIQELERRLEEVTYLLQRKNYGDNQNVYRIGEINQQDCRSSRSSIAHLKNIVSQANKESNLINTKIYYLHNELTSLINAMNNLAVMVQQHQTKILEKETEIDLEIKHTKFVLANWKKGSQCREDNVDENYQFSTQNTNDAFSKEKGKTWYKNEDQNSTNNNFESCGSSNFEHSGRRFNLDYKTHIQPLQNIQTSTQVYQGIPLTHMPIQLLSNNNSALAFRRTTNNI